MIAMLTEHFVPVAIDQAYQRRQQDSEGEFYRRIAGQGPRKDFRSTTQGFYVATASGDLLLYNNNRDPAKVRRLVREALESFRGREGDSAKPIETGERDARYAPPLPAGGLVVRVHARVLGGYPPAKDGWQRIFHGAISRDNLWVTRAEHEALSRGVVAESLAQRLARFHLVDNTRGEPPMWKADEVRHMEIGLNGNRIEGTVHLATDDGRRSFRGRLLGSVERTGDGVTELDVVASGLFRGEGRWTRGAPPGEFPFAVRFSLADGSDTADRIPPQGSRGWLRGYLQ